MRFFLLTIIGLLLITYVHAGTYATDSIGIEKIGDKVYVLHRVEEKETLYSLSKRYDVKINMIVAANPSSEFGLDIGEILKIPLSETNVSAEDGRVVHTVKPKETLYSISKAYGVEPDAIKEWNRISTSILDIGQKLIIYPSGMETSVVVDQPAETIRQEGYKYHTVTDGETLYSISKKYEVALEDLREWNDLSVNDISIGQDLIIGRTVKEVVVPVVASDPEPVENVTEVIYADAGTPLARENTNFDEVVENGLAEVIEGSSNNRKYLALHRTAKIGTIMRIRNEMNGQEVFVRIIGKLPDTGANRNILIKISRAAYDQLGAIDDKFRVTISFIP